MLLCAERFAFTQGMDICEKACHKFIVTIYANASTK